MKRKKNEDVGLLKVQVSKKLSLSDTASITTVLRKQEIICGLAYCASSNEYEVWRQVLSGDEPRVKNKKEGMTPHGVIEDDEDIKQRDFVVVWYKTDVLYIDEKSTYAIQRGLK